MTFASDNTLVSGPFDHAGMIVVALALAPVLIGWLWTALYRLAHRTNSQRAMRALSALIAPLLDRETSVSLKARSFLQAGDPHGASECLEQLLQLDGRLRRPAFLLNETVNTLISAGRYRAAIEWAQTFSARHPEHAAARGSRDATLVEINLAEAHYNLGDLDAAFACLAPLDQAADRDPLTRAGLHQQRAWLAALRGDGSLALTHLGQADRLALPLEFRPEHHYTRALALMLLGRLDEAAAAAGEGQAASRRPASARNALFLLGRIEAARKRWSEAARYLEAGAAHPWRGQGGDGLLLLGDLLTRLGRSGDAAAAWDLAIRRDPESASAALARERLPGLSSGGTAQRPPP